MLLNLTTSKGSYFEDLLNNPLPFSIEASIRKLFQYEVRIKFNDSSTALVVGILDMLSIHEQVKGWTTVTCENSKTFRNARRIC